MKAAILGAGVIGAGWAARFAVHGWDVAVWDPDPGASVRVAGFMERAVAALGAVYDVELPAPGILTFHAEPGPAVSGADWVQESVPETLTLKLELFASLTAHISPQVPLASSTSGFKPSQLACTEALSGQLLVCHPFNPVYLVPGVEVVPGPATAPGVVDVAMQTLTAVGMQPVRIRGEIDAHVADRLLEAVWREALWLVRDGIATTGEIDQIIRTSFGLRWAQMGLFETYRLGGGEGGFAHFLKQFGPALQWPWSRLTDVPELDQALIDRIVAQSDQQTGERSLDAMLDQRDRNLTALLRALKQVDDGAGTGLNQFEQRWLAGADRAADS